MSTHSFIGIEDETTGKVRGIYCHYDGYPDGVGYVLKKHYQDEHKLRELVKLGSISALREEIGDKHDVDDFFSKLLRCCRVAKSNDQIIDVVFIHFDFSLSHQRQPSAVRDQ